MLFVANFFSLFLSLSPSLSHWLELFLFSRFVASIDALCFFSLSLPLPKSYNECSLSISSYFCCCCCYFSLVWFWNNRVEKKIARTVISVVPETLRIFFFQTKKKDISISCMKTWKKENRRGFSFFLSGLCCVLGYVLVSLTENNCFVIYSLRSFGNFDFCLISSLSLSLSLSPSLRLLPLSSRPCLYFRTHSVCLFFYSFIFWTLFSASFFSYLFFPRSFTLHFCLGSLPLSGPSHLPQYGIIFKDFHFFFSLGRVFSDNIGSRLSPFLIWIIISETISISSHTKNILQFFSSSLCFQHKIQAKIFFSVTLFFILFLLFFSSSVFFFFLSFVSPSIFTIFFFFYSFCRF